ncbi:MAG: phosphonate-binding protein, partial [Mesorhizobium sp.]
VIARGRDLPNDILVARKDISDDVFVKVRDAFAKNGNELMKAILTGEDNQKFKGGFFLTDVRDSDYDYVRSMYRTIGIETLTDFVN